jgi:hypothetical protein
VIPLRAGDVLLLGKEASVQFAGDRVLMLRLMSVDRNPTYQGWVWLTGYSLNEDGTATEKREVFVQLAGVRRSMPPVPKPRPRPHLADTRTAPPTRSRRVTPSLV